METLRTRFANLWPMMIAWNKQNMMKHGNCRNSEINEVVTPYPFPPPRYRVAELPVQVSPSLTWHFCTKNHEIVTNSNKSLYES